ncbi:methyl-accepting chemotaxis protein [Roseateles sp. BYS87W]|uniref:Methyl-accepting chemotaxis protein n=1 Tax=Pelomonas baiyunensis TaxID=3299026 RepID=A0ABW7H1M4_9BURK
MLTSLKVGPRLVLGFALVLALLGIDSMLALSRLAALKADLAAVTGEAPERLASKLRDLARYQSVTIRDVIMQDDMAFKKKEFDLMKAARQDYDKTAQTLAGMVQDEPARAALARAATALAGTKGLIEKIVDLTMNDDMAGASAMVRDQLRPAQQAHVQALDAVIETIQAASHERDLAATSAYRTSVALIIGLSLAALAVGAVVAWRIQLSITRPLAEAVSVAQSIAEGDLSREIRMQSGDEVGRLMQALAAVNTDLSRIMLEVRTAADTMQTATLEIAAGNTDLSQRTEQQAANLEETASSMEELTATVRNTADTAQSASDLARNASTAADRGGQVVSRVVDTMQAISQSSRKITDIIGVIDGIAFQTNILALNAAVEAARAGEQGRGFAVVAGEVRSLAQRSAEAAREIKSLIGASMENVENGSTLVADAGSTMTDIVGQVQKVSRLIDEISQATVEQTRGLAQINEAVTQLDQMTQQNAALVEESAAASGSLSQQAERLVGTVGIFRLRNA